MKRNTNYVHCRFPMSQASLPANEMYEAMMAATSKQLNRLLAIPRHY
jgi:hypothetical protein